jgi:transcriptional regulator with PAS, ATPase and Fis domain
LHARARRPPRARNSLILQRLPFGDLESMERDMIDEALQRARFNKSKAAKALGLTRQQLYLRMRKYGLE